MRRRVKLVKDFNNLLTEFLTYIEKLFKKIGDNSDVIKVRMLKNKLELGKKADAKGIVDNFWFFVKDHIDQIYDRDTQYFLEQDFRHFGVENDHETQQDALKLRELWASNQISDNDKEDIWITFETLVNQASIICK